MIPRSSYRNSSTTLDLVPVCVCVCVCGFSECSRKYTREKKREMIKERGCDVCVCVCVREKVRRSRASPPQTQRINRHTQRKFALTTLRTWMCVGESANESVGVYARERKRERERERERENVLGLCPRT